MVDVSRTFDVTVPSSTILEYLRDFSHAEEWDPGTKQCDLVGDGPIEVGSHWHNVSEFRGRETELDYELSILSDDHVVFRGTNKSATSIDDIRVTSTPTGSQIVYHATIDFHGLARLAGPFLQKEFERLGDETQEQMTRVLNKLPH